VLVVLDSGSGGIVLRRVVKTQFCTVVLGVWTGVFGLGSGEATPQVKVRVGLPAEIRIRVESLPPGREWSFRNAYAGVLGIAERVEQFQAVGVNGDAVAAKKITVGEFRSERDVTAISYLVRLPPPRASDVSHVSWIAGKSGFLMLADLLPQQLTDVLVEFSLPSGWSSQSTIETDAQGKYQVAEPEKTVFFIGSSLRTQSKRVEGVELESVVSGEWPFKDSVVLNSAKKVIEKYVLLTGFKLTNGPTVMIAPLPVATGSVKWRAETRGSAVVLLMDPQAKIENWAGQLGIIFTHELFHLWVPNSLQLHGDYDWFSEGFTLYTALHTALELKFINFNEYLATLTRVYDSYLSRPEELSLIAASERRWTSSNSVVYDRGMLVAFLYDLAIRRDSGGKRWLGSLYRNLFAGSAVQPANGNEVIIQLLSSTPAGADLVKSYIEGQQELDLKPLLTDRKQLLKTLKYR